MIDDEIDKALTDSVCVLGVVVTQAGLYWYSSACRPEDLGVSGDLAGLIIDGGRTSGWDSLARG